MNTELLAGKALMVGAPVSMRNIQILSSSLKLLFKFNKFAQLVFFLIYKAIIRSAGAGILALWYFVSKGNFPGCQDRARLVCIVYRCKIDRHHHAALKKQSVNK